MEMDESISTIVGSDTDSDMETSDGEGMFDMFTQEARVHQPSIVNVAQSESDWEVLEDFRKFDLPIRSARPRPQDYETPDVVERSHDIQTDTTDWESVSQSVAPSVRSDVMSVDELSEEPYQWTPLADLQMIRVVDILPKAYDSDNEPIQVRTRTLSLREFAHKPDECYQTLSYAWGSKRVDGSHLAEKIYCDGRLLRITANLHAALRRIRKYLDEGKFSVFGRRAPLWVDAICIDANDPEERGNQVLQMAQIYGLSSRVIVWLGEAHQREDAVISQMVDRITNQDSMAAKLTAEAARPAVESVLSRSWFHRRWVIQEYAMNSNRAILLGSSIIETAKFISLLNALGLQKHAGPMTYTRLFDSFRVKRWLPATLHQFSKAQCALPHDLVYALLPISCGCGHSKSVCAQKKACGGLVDFHINYEEDVERLFTRLARDWADTDVLTVLACASVRRPAQHVTPSNMPSWVPDWRIPICSSSEVTRGFIEECVQPWENSMRQLSVGRTARLPKWRAGDPYLSCGLHLQGWLFQRLPRGCESKERDVAHVHQIEPAITPNRRGTAVARSVGYTLDELFDVLGDNIGEHFRDRWPALEEDEVVCFLRDSRLAFVLKRHHEEGTYTLVCCFRRPLVSSDLRFVLLSEEDGKVWLKGSMHPLDQLLCYVRLI